MKTNRILVTLLFSIVCLSLKSQIVITNVDGQTAGQAIAGNSVIIPPSLVTTNSGSQDQIGTFTFPNSIIGFNDGVILSTGNVANADGPNVNNETGTMPSGGDADLNKLFSGTTNAVVLEFDFIPTTGSVSFDYIFASDEYEDFLGQAYHDVFAFLISGPNIQPDVDVSGNNKFSNGAKNLALVSGSPVSTKTIGPSVNSSLYNYYEPRAFWQQNGGTGTFPNTKMEFDGYTDVLTATASGLTCGQTYHLKIALADVGDADVDSWVLIKAGSLDGNFTIGEISDLAPVCEGTTQTLTITGDNGYTYLWSNGVSGKTNTFIASAATTVYSVVVTNPTTGCAITKTKEIIVHSSQNIEPYITEADGSPVRPVYFYEPDVEKCLGFIGQDPSSSEKVTMKASTAHPRPQGVDVDILGGNLALPEPVKYGNLCWTPTSNQVGVHSVFLEITDNNSCAFKTVYQEIKLKVKCGSCPQNKYYESKSLAVKNPLPESTIVADFITAGEDVTPTLQNGPVIVTASEEVTFVAGKSINLEPGFIVEPGATFEARIGDDCFTQEACDACCQNWTGWPTGLSTTNVLSPNGDGFNDFWGVFDNDNPFCAYKAQGYELFVFNRWGEPVCAKNENYLSCCPFRSVPGERPSIFWDGNFCNSGATVPSGVYTVVLKVWSCNKAEFTFSSEVTVFTPSSKSQSNENAYDTSQKSILKTVNTEANAFKQDSLEVENNKVFHNSNHFLISPNPAYDVVSVSSQNDYKGGVNIILYDNTGKILKKKKIEAFAETTFNISALAKGTYYINIVDEQENIYIYKVIKL